MTTLTEILPRLRAPFTPAAVKWKIQTNPKNPQGSAMVVGFIDSRLVAERLNDVAGGAWSDAYGPIFGKSVVCRLSVLDAVREDVGWSATVDTDMGVKTVYSDAFKRAAVKFGIGAFLYAMPSQWVPANALQQRGQSWILPQSAQQRLAGIYAAWLGNETVAARFGAAIDHGDPDPVEVAA